MADASGDVVTKWRGILDDLLSLEVNTVLKDNMVATKIPNPADALIDIGQDYWMELNTIAPTGEEQPKAWGKAEFRSLGDTASTLARAFQGRPPRGEGNDVPAKPVAPEDAPKFFMLCRIRETCDQLQGFFPEDDLKLTRGNADEMAKTLKLTDKQKLLMRKAWEMGTEEVVMQTIVYIDGDVITRVRPDFARAGDDRVLDIHRQSLDTLIQRWGKLVEAIGAFVKSIAEVFAGR